MSLCSFFFFDHVQKFLFVVEIRLINKKKINEDFLFDMYTQRYFIFFVFFRNSKNIIIWLDNCTAQNKNWELFVTILLLVNSVNVNIQKVSLKYFEPGHTYMSADSFHAAVERSIKRCPEGKVLDFNEYVNVVESSCSGATVLKMNGSDFYKLKLKIPQSRLNKMKPRPFLKDMVNVWFERGSYSFSYNYVFEDENNIELLSKREISDFVNKGRDIFQMMESSCIEKGMHKDAKTHIVKHLCPLFPETNALFWKNLKEFEE